MFYAFLAGANPVNLYRIMTDVCAGSHQRTVMMGELGIVTLWVRAESEMTALARAKLILTNRRYASIGRLQSYAEALDNDPVACETEEERAADRRRDWALAGYDALREQALAQADGLHEVWLGAPVPQFVRQRQIA
jgi:hypothetical protein